MGVINAPAGYIQTWINQSFIDRYDSQLTSGQLETLWSFVVSIFLIGAAFGSIAGSMIADKFGRCVNLLKKNVYLKIKI